MKGLNFAAAISAIVALTLTACETAPTATDPTDETQVLIAAGHDIVRDNCTSCHSVSTGRSSAMPKAPALSTVLEDRNIESLADDLREGIHIGDPSMPSFDFDPMEADAITAYLISIRE